MSLLRTRFVYYFEVLYIHSDLIWRALLMLPLFYSWRLYLTTWVDCFKSLGSGSKVRLRELLRFEILKILQLTRIIYIRLLTVLNMEIYILSTSVAMRPCLLSKIVNAINLLSLKLIGLDCTQGILIIMSKNLDSWARIKFKLLNAWVLQNKLSLFNDLDIITWPLSLHVWKL